MQRVGRFFAAVLAIILTVLSSAGIVSGVHAAPNVPDQYVAGEILVKFRPGVSGQAIADVHRQNGGQVKSSIPGIEVQVVVVPVGQELARVNSYRQNPNVLFAEVNGLYHAIGDTTNDPKVGDQWQYNNTGQAGGTIDADVDAFEAWHVTPGSNTVRIAILDTGIDQDHEDLAVAANVNYTTSDTVDDKYGHGTHVAGSAAAITNNSKGVAGTCPNCALVNVKVLGDGGSGQWDWIANGIRWAADNNAKVINMSLGGSSGSDTVAAAIDYAWGKGVVIVAAAGNDGSSSPSYPAFYEKVIAVAATDRNDAKADFSNYGSWVDVAAPGKDILSTAPNHRNRIWILAANYGTISGTSMASPHVAGVAGLVWSKYGTSTSVQTIRNYVESTADDIPGTGSSWTHGRVNACRAVGGTNCTGTTNSAPTVTITSPADNATFDSGSSIAFSGSATDSKDGDISNNLVWTTDKGIQIGTGPSFSATLSDGTHTITAAVTDSDGATGSSSITIVVGSSGGDATLAVTVTTPKTIYSFGETVQITVEVTDGTNPVSTAAVHVEVATPSGKTYAGDGTTGSDGKVTFSYKTKRGDGKGTYTVTATASKSGYSNGSNSTTFTVN